MTDQTFPEPDDVRDAPLRAALADVPRAPAAVKDAAIAAALALYDTQVTGTEAPHQAAAVVSLDSRRRWPTRVLTAAAAVAAVGVIGVTALRGNDKASDSNSASADEYAVVMGATATTAATAGGAAPTADSFIAVATPIIAVNSPEQLRDLVAAKVAPEVAADANEARDSGSPALACLTSDQQYIADITYAGTPAIAARDTVTGVIQAIDEQCNVLAEVKP
ncbi:MAG TPA: hypothetical protein PLV13_00105 [Ilumatobacteraceae bacterium]|nr:hypothetical protein [Ilumatobacteraceae bacterium]